MYNIKILQKMVAEYGLKEVLRVLGLLTDPNEVHRIAAELKRHTIQAH